MKIRDKWITAAFLAVILTIPFLSVAKNIMVKMPQTEMPSEEQAAADKSAFIVLQDKINKFTSNTFARKELIMFNTELTSLLTGGTYIESTQVLKGKNNMFFYKTELDGHPPLWDYMGIDSFSDEQLENITKTLVETRDYLAGKGIEFYVMCAPNKEIIYPENMPDTIARVSEVSRGEQLSNYVNQNTDLVFVYPKDALIERKDEAQLYYLTDTHSNQKGSFVMMQELFKEAYGTYAELSTVSFTTDVTDHAGDLVHLAGLNEKYKIDHVYSFDKDSADKAQYHDQSLLFVGDSFGGFLSAVSKGYYRDVYWEHPDKFEYSMYEEYKPDVVILERSERYCDKLGEKVLVHNKNTKS